MKRTKAVWQTLHGTQSALTLQKSGTPPPFLLPVRRSLHPLARLLILKGGAAWEAAAELPMSLGPVTSQVLPGDANKPV